MSEAIIPALSIARPLAQTLAERSFKGHVLGVFNRACNLIDAYGQMVALVIPEIGNGPFAITVPGTAGLFDPLSPGQPAYGDAHTLRVGNLTVSLKHASIWDPCLPIPNTPLDVRLMVNLLEPHLAWPSFNEGTRLAHTMATLARQATAQLSRGLSQLKIDAIAVASLAGLGNGLTPAGDDFLLGTMAALRFSGHTDLSLRVAAIAAPRTGALSRAFLTAAGRGEFIEPWHTLAQAWASREPTAITASIQQVANFGASSGRDALAGFGHALRAIAIDEK